MRVPKWWTDRKLWERTSIVWFAWLLALGLAGAEVGLAVWILAALAVWPARGIRWGLQKLTTDKQFREITKGWDA